jgi:choline-glycine betaine transporter
MSADRARVAGALAILACSATVSLVVAALIMMWFGGLPAARVLLIISGVTFAIAFILIIVMFVNAPPDGIRRWRVRRQFRREARRQRRTRGVQRWQ